MVRFQGGLEVFMLSVLRYWNVYAALLFSIFYLVVMSYPSQLQGRLQMHRVQI